MQITTSFDLIPHLFQVPYEPTKILKHSKAKAAGFMVDRQIKVVLSETF